MLGPPPPERRNAQPRGKNGVTRRKGGTRQWAYEGKPLYTWHRDKKPGETKGDGFKGVWHAAKAA